MARRLLILGVLLSLARPVFAQDAAQFYKGTFTASGSTGDQTITGIVDDDANSFTPKAVLIWGSQQASAAATDGFFWNLGITDCTNQRTLWGSDEDNVGTTVTRRSAHNARLIDTYDAGGSNLSRATIVSCGSGQVVINWSVADAATPIFHLVAFGGSAVGGAANTFQPNVAAPLADNATFFATAILAFPTSVGANTTTTSQLVTGAGFIAHQSDGGYQQASGWSCGETGQAATDARRVQITTSGIAQATGSCTGSSMIYSYQGNYGFLDITANNEWVWTLSLGGALAKVGADLQPTSATTQAITGVGFEPKLVLFFSVGNTATASVTTEGRWSFGAATPDAQGSIWLGDLNAADPTVTARKHTTTDVLNMGTPDATGSSSTFQALASVTAWGADGFTLTWSVADATQRQFIWIAFGVPSVTPSATPASYVF